MAAHGGGMKIHDCVQNSPEWLALRRGIPTASRFHEIWAPVRRRPSKSRDLYLLELVDEWLTGAREEPYENKWTRRGQELEPVARFAYEMEHGVQIQTVGFVTRDDGKVGGSPDGLIGNDTVLEIKIPAPHVHQRCIEGGYTPRHTAQVQGLMYLCERERTALWVFSDTKESVRHWVERDDEYLRGFVPALDEFLDELEEAKAQVFRDYARAG